MSLIVELDDFKFHLISLLLWLAAGGTKGNDITEEGLTHLKRLVNPRLQEVSFVRDHTIGEAAHSLSHFTLKTCTRTLQQKRKMNPRLVISRWLSLVIIGYIKSSSGSLCNFHSTCDSFNMTGCFQKYLTSGHLMI